MAEPKSWQRRLPGGEHPELAALFQETLSDFQDHFAEYLVAGIAQFAVTMAAVLVAVFAGYLLMTVGILVLGFALVGLLIAAEQALGDDAAALLMIPGQLTMFLGFLVGAGMFGALMGGVLAPMHASLTRAVAAHQRGEQKLEPMAAFSTLTVRPVGAFVAGSMTAGLAVAGIFLCYLPALLVPVLFGFGGTLVALHPLGGLRALALSARHALANPSWALPFGLVSSVLLMVSGNVPVVGPMFVLSLQVRAHRYVFGDADEPVLSAAGSSEGDRNTQ